MPQTPDLSKYLDAGAEFVALTRSQARERAQELVKQGELSKNQVTGFVDGLVEESRRRTDFFMDVVRQEIQRQVQAVGIATKDDLVKLEAKLAKQTKVAKQPGAKASSAKAGAKKAGKKATAKKSGTTAAKKTKKATPKSSSTRAAAAS
jgi:polyhydroxyalkanoate synthesis regulator phasin